MRTLLLLTVLIGSLFSGGNLSGENVSNISAHAYLVKSPLVEQVVWVEEEIELIESEVAPEVVTYEEPEIEEVDEVAEVIETEEVVETAETEPTVDEKDVKIAELENAITKLEEEKASLEEKINGLLQQIEQLKLQVNQTAQERETIRTEKEALVIQLSKKETDFENLWERNKEQKEDVIADLIDFYHGKVEISDQGLKEVEVPIPL